jgi:hypothetical protein
MDIGAGFLTAIAYLPSKGVTVIATAKALVTAGLTIGLIATGGAGTAFAATPTALSATVLADRGNSDPHPHPQPPFRGGPGPVQHGKDGNRGGGDRNHNWNNNWNRDRDHNRDRDRDHNRGDNWGVSPERCRDGGGHVNWHRDRCDGGRFDGDRIR